MTVVVAPPADLPRGEPPRLASATWPETSRFGCGTVLPAGSVSTTEVTVGRHVVVMPDVTLVHDDTVAGFATLCAAVAPHGHVVVQEHVHLGMGSSVQEHTTVGARSVLGLGALLPTDFPSDQTWTPVPARPRQPTTSIGSSS